MGALSLCKQYKMGRIRNIYQNFATKVGIFALRDRRKQFTEILWAKLALGLNKAFSQNFGLKVQHLWFSRSILRTVLFSLHCLYSLDCLYFWPLSNLTPKTQTQAFPINLSQNQYWKTKLQNNTKEDNNAKNANENEKRGWLFVCKRTYAPSQVLESQTLFWLQAQYRKIEKCRILKRLFPIKSQQNIGFA